MGCVRSPLCLIKHIQHLRGAELMLCHETKTGTLFLWFTVVIAVHTKKLEQIYF